MDVLAVALLCAILCSYSNCTPMQPYDTIIVGLGAAGSSAAGTLAAAGRKVLALEAQGRVGGRVNTVPFGDGVVELGAEWIHGTDPSSVYDLAVRHNVSVLPQDLSFKVYQSDGSSNYTAIVDDLVAFCLGVVGDPPETPEPLGQYITKRVREYINTNHTSVANDKDFIDNFLEFMDLVIDNYESSNSWNDVSTATQYRELQGHQHMSWHTHGYKTLFDILLNTYKNGPGYPNLDVKLNTEVTKIEWPQEPKDSVIVTVKDGTKYTANNAIVTVSLGVLKERYTTLFYPALPDKKTKIINDLSIGLVDKVVLIFDEPFWPKDAVFFGFIWKGEDRAKVSSNDLWTTKIFAASCPKGNTQALTVWTNGDTSKLVETLPDDEVRTKVMGVIRKFMGSDKTIPEPVGILRSSWYSNPFTRGSYSFDNILTPQQPTARRILASPLLDSAGTPRLLFAGEATHDTHFSTVHGAVDSGTREASRILNRQSKL